jgi:group I intron endonuclease
MSYSNGKIYKIFNTQNDKLYVGSTTQSLNDRLKKHKSCVNGLSLPFYKAVLEIGKANFYIELIEDYPCNSKQELNAREGYWIKHFDTAKIGYNKNVAGRTVKEHYQEEIKGNPEEKIKNIERQKRFLENNKEHRAEYLKEHNEKNKEHYKEYYKEYYQENKDRANEMRRNKTQIVKLFKVLPFDE